MDLLRRTMRYQVRIGALIELALWLTIPYLCIGFVWTLFHAEEARQIQTWVEAVFPAAADAVAFGLTTALWPASIQIGHACPAP